MNLYERLKDIQTSNPYFSKDLKKAQKANKFIGQGSLASSTNKYMVAAGNLANTGKYDENDIVFISAEGLRKGRKNINTDELLIAIEANVKFVTDNITDRQRHYNLGEREVASFLEKHQYKDNGTGVWKK